jgi:hypothetical protein
MSKKDPEIASRKIVIENKTSRGIELPRGDYDGDGRIERKVLYPGENNINEQAWKKAKINPAIKIYVSCRYLIDRGPGEAKSLIQGLDALDLSDARDRVARCDEIKILKDWKTRAKKPKYKALCEARIKEILDADDL